MNDRPSAVSTSDVDPRGLPAQGVARNTVFALLVQITTLTFTAATSIYLIRVLGPTGYGTFTLALGLAGVTSLVAKFGMPQALARFLAHHRHDSAASSALVRDALRLTLVFATFAGTALFLAAGPIAHAYHQDELRWPLRAVAISLVAETVFALYLSVFISLARIGMNLRIVFVESLFEAGATIALVAAGAGATGAAFGRATGYTVGTIVATLIVLRLFGRIRSTSPENPVRPRRTRMILGYAVPLFIIDSIYGLYSRIDVLLIGGLLTTSSVGLYAAPARLLPAFESVSLAVANSVSPRQAPAEAGRYLGHFTAALRWLAILYGVSIAPLVVWAGPIVALLFGPKYHESANVLRVFAPYVFLNSVSPLVSTTVNYLGLAKLRVPIAAGALGVNAVIDVVLLPRIGVVAGAIGSSAAFLVYVPAHVLICRRQLGFAITPFARTVVRTLIAAAAMGGVLAAVGRTDLTALSVAVGLLGGIAAYIGSLLLTREVSGHEVLEAYHALGRRVRRGRNDGR